MRCISSPPLEDAQLVSFIDGEVDESVIVHIEQCAFCRERAELWTGQQKHLRGRLYRRDCPSSMTLGEYRLRMLPAPQLLVIAQHLRECVVCRQEVAELENTLVDLSPDWDILKPIQILIATLGGSNRALAANALRGTSRGLKPFVADGVVITLGIQPAQNGQVSIRGNVDAENQAQWTGATVVLQQTDGVQQISSLDEDGVFHFVRAQTGSTEITITTSDDGIIVQIPKFDLTI